MSKSENIKAELQQIEKAKKERSAFAPLYEKYFDAIFRFVFYRIQDEQITADVTSQTFLKAMMSINKFEYKGYPFSAWLYRIALNEVYTYYRELKKNQEIELSENDVYKIIDEAEIKNEAVSLESVIEALNNLKLEHTQLIEFRFFEKLSFKEIGEIYGITEANAKTKVYRVLKELKNLITLTEDKA